ncbi:1-propanol dehydrogenase PduQ [Anaerosalibacter massiliensis]|uniref:Iron-containing alcohol dehydrogenase n=1 Tax=Anaerosalibacter massiliensis TaxID=1347392 RepID=A0A9X2S4W8_9FIRM|nr:1-propanol dehydrogenase PduQ [Anaerosalibacter massiliensis]MCR2044070.1 iron-containing alcohol dehydrogenase [Anaerosalibacter massiliensis]
MKKFSLKPHIVHEKESIEYLRKINIKNSLIITDKFMVKFGITKKVTDILEEEKINYEVFSKVEPNPSSDLVIDGIDLMLKFRPDSIIAIGGGSAIDTAKGIILFYMNMMNESNKKHVKKPYFIAIPTTSGTGSEVTSYSVITDNDTHGKMAFSEDIMLADLAIVDPDFTNSVPPSVTADTGMDVFTHALEALVSNQSSDFTDTLASGVLKIVFSYLLRAYRDGNDTLARQKMHNASCMAGIAFTNSALGINHSMGHAFGARFKVSHGRSVAIFLPYIIEYNSLDNTCAYKYNDVAKSIGLPASSIEQGVSSLIESIKVLNRKLGIPVCIKEMDIDGKEFFDEIENMSQTAMEDVCTIGNPRKPTKDDIIMIFKKAYEG